MDQFTGSGHWEVEDEDGDLISAETVFPDPGMLDRLSADSGTTVILHGDGRSDTWDASVSYQVHKFLTRRYYDFGSDMSVYVHDTASDQLRAVVPVGNYLATYSQCEGEIPFYDIAGLNGVMCWWIIPAASEAQEMMRSASIVPGGVGLVVEDEIFDYAKSYLGDFGVIYQSVQARVAILIFIDGAEMSTARVDLVLPGENRKTIPWKKLGAYFAEKMPDEIDAMMSKITVTSSSFDAEMAKMLDKDWMKNLALCRYTFPLARANHPPVPNGVMPPRLVRTSNAKNAAS